MARNTLFMTLYTARNGTKKEDYLLYMSHFEQNCQKGVNPENAQKPSRIILKPLRNRPKPGITRTGKYLSFSTSNSETGG